MSFFARMMPLAWVYRALLLNEFTSDDYDEGDAGQLILQSYGFLHNGEPFTRDWIGYCFAYLFPFLAICTVISATCLHHFRMEPTPKGIPGMTESIETKHEKDHVSNSLRDAAFIPVK